LVKNETWDLVDIPKGQKIIKSKWVLTTTKNADGEIDRYKARIVVKGCSQRKGLDYSETYATHETGNIYVPYIIHILPIYLPYIVHTCPVKHKNYIWNIY